jgi:type IV pilus assembly protein PilB
VPHEKLIELGFSEEQAKTIKMYRGKGCSNCANSGYKGRIAVYEVMDFSPNLKEMVLHGSTMIELKKQAVLEGMRTLRMSALNRAAEARTSLEEALSMTMEG